MKAWILSICGIAFLGVMVDVVSPQGKMNNFIKSIFAILFLFVMVKPIVNMVTGVNSITTSFEFDNELLDVIAEQKINALEAKTQLYLIELGYIDYSVEIHGKMENNEIIISHIYIVDCSGVLKTQQENINISNNIADIVGKYLSVDKEVIMFE